MNAISTSINIPVYTTIQDIQTATHEDAHPQELKTYTVQGQPLKRKEVAKGIRQYWKKRNE